MKEIGRQNLSQETINKWFEKDHKGHSISELTDKTVDINGFVIYDNEGGYHLKFETIDGTDFYASSQVFIKDFMRIAKNANDAPFKITTKEGTSKKNRKFYFVEEASKYSEKKAHDEWKSMEW